MSPIDDLTPEALEHFASGVMPHERPSEVERMLSALAPVVRWGCAPALGGGLTDVDGVWASEIFKVLPELEPYVLALIDDEAL